MKMAWVPYVPLEDRYFISIYLSYISYPLLLAAISLPSLPPPLPMYFFVCLPFPALSTGSAGWKAWKQKYSLLAAPSEGQYYSYYFNTLLTICAWELRFLLHPIFLYMAGLRWSISKPSESRGLTTACHVSWIGIVLIGLMCLLKYLLLLFDPVVPLLYISSLLCAVHKYYIQVCA